MIVPPAGLRVYLAAGVTDMRKGFDGLARLVAERLSEDVFGGGAYVFRGRRGDRIKVLWWGGSKLKETRLQNISGFLSHLPRLEWDFEWDSVAQMGLFWPQR